MCLLLGNHREVGQGVKVEANFLYLLKLNFIKSDLSKNNDMLDYFRKLPLKKIMKVDSENGVQVNVLVYRCPAPLLEKPIMSLFFLGNNHFRL